MVSQHRGCTASSSSTARGSNSRSSPDPASLEAQGDLATRGKEQPGPARSRSAASHRSGGAGSSGKRAQAMPSDLRCLYLYVRLAGRCPPPSW